MNKRRGISLITLVITIVVVIILTVAVIFTIAGEDGLIARANKAKMDHLISNDIQLLQMEFNDLVTQKATELIDNISTGEYKIHIESHGYNTYDEDDEYFALFENQRLYSYEVVNGKLEINYIGLTSSNSSSSSGSNSVEITFEPNGGSVAITNLKQVFGETYKELPIPTKDGYSFVGWTTENDNMYKTVDTNTIVSINENHTLYALWEKYNLINLEESFTNYGSYGFKFENGALEPQNLGINYSTARAYFEIDLSNYTSNDMITITVLASSSCEFSDHGYATIRENSSPIEYNETNTRFLDISDRRGKTEYSTTVQGGKVYYLHIGYYKDNSNSYYDDKVYIHSIKYGRTLKIHNRTAFFVSDYSFQPVGNYFVSNNANVDNSLCSASIKVSLDNLASSDVIAYDFETIVSSEENKDFAYIYVTNSPTIPNLNSDEGRIYVASGNVKESVRIELNGGRTYYIHFIYSKDSSGSSNDDSFKFRELFKLGEYEVNYINGYYYFERMNNYMVPNNKNKDNSIAEIYFKIDLSNYTEQERFCINLQAAISSEGADRGYAIVTENTNVVGSGNSTNRFMYISGEVGKGEYAKIVNGGKVYYVHVGYEKDKSQSYGADFLKLYDLSVSREARQSYWLVYPYGRYSFSNSVDYIQSSNLQQHNSSCNSYIKMDLSRLPSSEKYRINVESIADTEADKDIGYVAVTQNNSIPDFKNCATTFLITSGEEEKTEYIDVDGGKIYYVHFAYIKDESGNSGRDCVKFKMPIKLGEYELSYNNETYIFIQQNNYIVPTNYNVDNSEAKAYVKIDLTEYSENDEFMVKLKASCSSEGADRGYANITNNTNSVGYSDNTGRFMTISGSVGLTEYTTTVKGGSVHYLHLGYYKDRSMLVGEDKVKFHDLKVEKK